MSVFAQTIGPVTRVWSNTVGGFVGNPSCAVYNWATDHFLICDYAAPAVRVANNTDGALTGGTLNLTGLTMDTLGVFAITATKDGVIYGTTNTGTTNTDPNLLFRWANETAAPTQQSVAPTVGNMQFGRALDALGTGANTVLAVTGDSANYNATLLTTTDGTTFAVTDATPAGGGTGIALKQGVVLASATKVYGTQCDGAYWITGVEKVGGVWAAIATFVPPAAADIGNPSAVGFARTFNALFLMGQTARTGTPATDPITILDGTTGAQLQQVDTAGVAGTFGYGKIDVDDTLGVAYFAARSNTATSELMGKLTFAAAATPTPSVTPTQPPTSARPSWGLYE